MSVPQRVLLCLMRVLLHTDEDARKEALEGSSLLRPHDVKLVEVRRQLTNYQFKILNEPHFIFATIIITRNASFTPDGPRGHAERSGSL